ncbi:PA domain [Rhizoctonia solani]|uniref:RING-type E3 ubiquitin transferase n=1 Tax=Rhizoctonia solani TaxID=456999 RepID=A0A8H7HDK9_9AGAM|nr:PA domain [Rhizoctonia solani]
MRIGAYATLFVLGAWMAEATPIVQQGREEVEHSWGQLVRNIARAFGMRRYRQGTNLSVDLGIPQTGDSWLWNLNGWSMAESELSLVDQEPIQTFTTRPAIFGTHIVTSPGLLGHLLPLSSFTVHTNKSHDQFQTTTRGTIPYPIARDNTGCPPLQIPDHHPRPSVNESWIALIMRGGCSFDDKVRQAQKLGARAAIVGGKPQDPPEELVSMSPSSDTQDIVIPAVYVTRVTYAALIDLIASSNISTSGLRTVSVVLGPEETWAWWSPILSFAILLLLPSIMTLVTVFVHRVRAARHAARQRAPGDVVRALPIRVWTGAGWVSEKDWIASHPNEVAPEPEADSTLAQDERDEEAGQATPVPESEGHPTWYASQAECAICLCSFARGDRVRVLPCSHVFHVDEVDGWLLNRKKVCPICKADVTHPAPRTTPRVFPVAVHPSDTDNRTAAASGTGVLEGDSGVGSAIAPERSPGWISGLWNSGPGYWWRRVRARRQEATERTPLLSS